MDATMDLPVPIIIHLLESVSGSRGGCRARNNGGKIGLIDHKNIFSLAIHVDTFETLHTIFHCIYGEMKVIYSRGTHKSVCNRSDENRQSIELNPDVGVVPIDCL